jgi:hypothetical protein
MRRYTLEKLGTGKFIIIRRDILFEDMRETWAWVIPMVANFTAFEPPSTRETRVCFEKLRECPWTPLGRGLLSRM